MNTKTNKCYSFKIFLNKFLFSCYKVKFIVFFLSLYGVNKYISFLKCNFFKAKLSNLKKIA